MPSRLFRRALGGATAIGVVFAAGFLRPIDCYAALLSTPAPQPIRLAYAPNDGVPAPPPSAAEPAKPTPPAQADVIANVIRNAFAAYAAGDVRAGDALASEIADPLARTALEWQALHAPADLGFSRFAAFLGAHPDWPAEDWATRQAEESLWRAKPSPELVINFFAHRAPETALGSLALARAELTNGDKATATDRIRHVWRDDTLFASLEGDLRAQFGDVLTAADDKARADRLIYMGDIAAGLRAAAHAGNDELLLARAAAAARANSASAKILQTVPAAERRDPLYIFADVETLAGAKKIKEAAAALLAAPTDPAALTDPDAWWALRRKIARKLLDAGDASTAYRIVAAAAPGRPETNIDEAFHAGWIALRFLSDAKRAEPHFAHLATIATAPVSRARGDYWLGRTMAALGRPQDALTSYAAAAAYPTTYYGQLARAEAGQAAPAPTPMPAPAQGDARAEAIRVVAFLETHDQKGAALDLAIAAAKALSDPSQLVALAAVGRAVDDARETLAVGKIAERSGLPLTDDAFPTFGVPNYAPAPDSAPPEIVYAIARQESAFRTDARSSAGAKGLMQMIVSTAERTAQRFKIPFDAHRLETDPAFNAKLGAAHLGLLLNEQKGSLILTFAAYNAGGGRVHEWIDAYGDPRKPGVDPIDWVERIPIPETRDYVQRVMENYNVYKDRFAALRMTPAPAPTPPPVSKFAVPTKSSPADPTVSAKQAKS